MNISPEIKTIATVSIPKEDFRWLFDTFDFPKNNNLVIVNVHSWMFGIKDILSQIKIPESILRVMELANKANIGFVQFGTQAEYIEFVVE